MRLTWIVALVFSGLVYPHAAQAQQEPIQMPLFKSGENGYHTYRIPALLVTQKKTVLAFCEARKTSSADQGNIDLVLRRSKDGGRTWENLEVVADEGDHTMGNPCPVVDRKTGTLWLPYCRDNKHVFVIKSEDDGNTWSKPIEITESVKKPTWSWYATGPGVGIQTRTGRLVIPCDSKSGGGKVRESHVIYSDDGGKSWKLGGIVGPDCNEAQIAELSDGSLMLNIRSYRGKNRRLVAMSKDGGETFADPVEDAALIEPVCQASLVRDPNGGLVFSNPASTKRMKMTVRYSKDDGKTWPYARVLFEGPSAYSCLTILPDGDIGCVYEHGEKSPYKTLTFARFTRTWLVEAQRK